MKAVAKPPLRMRPCYGRNPRTGKRVGSRHRWEYGTCKFCGKFKDQVLTRE